MHCQPIKLCFQYKYLDSEQTTVQHVINPSSHSYKILPYNYYISTLMNKTNSVPEITFFLYVQKLIHSVYLQSCNKSMTSIYRGLV